MESYKDEVARIQAVYAARKADGLPAKYSPFMSYNLCVFQEREATLAALLHSNGIKSLAG